MPPADKAAGWEGSREGVRDGPHDRACRELAPCKLPTGGPPGVRTQGTKGDEGGHTAPPPPPPSPPPTHERGEDSEGTARGHGGGGAGQTTTPGGETGGKRCRRQAARAWPKKKGKTTRQSRERKQTRTGHGRKQGARKGVRERGKPQG